MWEYFFTSCFPIILIHTFARRSPATQNYLAIVFLWMFFAVNALICVWNDVFCVPDCYYSQEFLPKVPHMNGLLRNWGVNHLELCDDYDDDCYCCCCCCVADDGGSGVSYDALNDWYGTCENTLEFQFPSILHQSLGSWIRRKSYEWNSINLFLVVTYFGKLSMSCEVNEKWCL